jgi:protein-tyrosine phosphatase
MKRGIGDFVDIHCHLLPGLDDGASTLDNALAMARLAAADGIKTIVATPHQLGTFSKNSGNAIREAAARFQQELDQRGIPIRVLPGADVRIEPDLVKKIRLGEVLALADCRRHVLLELPHDVYFPLDRLLAELAVAGLTGILSHPERNLGIQNFPVVLEHLIDRGCLLQITAGSLTGMFGSQCEKLAVSMVRQGLAHFISTDAHGTRVRPPIMRAAFERAAELAGEATATALCCRNPAAVAVGNAVALQRQKAAEPVRNGWFRRTFSLERITPEPI